MPQQSQVYIGALQGTILQQGEGSSHQWKAKIHRHPTILEIYLMIYRALQMAETDEFRNAPPQTTWGGGVL
jgi:hypothetical protein